MARAATMMFEFGPGRRKPRRLAPAPPSVPFAPGNRDIPPGSRGPFLLDYLDAEGDRTMRWVSVTDTQPGLVAKGMFGAHCHLRGAPRQFRFDRILGLSNADGAALEGEEIARAVVGAASRLQATPGPVPVAVSGPIPAEVPPHGIVVTSMPSARVPVPVAAFDLDALADGWRDVLDGR
jgi:hypothetical protein